MSVPNLKPVPSAVVKIRRESLKMYNLKKMWSKRARLRLPPLKVFLLLYDTEIIGMRHVNSGHSITES